MRVSTCGIILLATQPLCAAAHAERSLTTIYNFAITTTAPRGPSSNLAVGANGSIFGAAFGGPQSATVYKLTPPAGGQTAWTETTLWSSGMATQGNDAAGGVIRNAAGDLFGTTTSGGKSKCGTVFELKRFGATYKYAKLWNFLGGSTDGCQASAALVMDTSGALYGNTFRGANGTNGAVFKLTPPAPGTTKWTESVIWNFSGTDGSTPSTQMIFDTQGNLFGTAYNGGSHGDGTVWELNPPAAGQTAWSFQLIWAFSDTDGANPTRGPLVGDANGNLYGTCHAGGAHLGGVVFRLTPPADGGTSWTETTLWSFTGKDDGADPTSGLAITKDGRLIGATERGGSSAKYGTIFKLLPPADGKTAWTEKTLAAFDTTNGSDPEMPPVILPNRVILGTTQSGGTMGGGTVWELVPDQP